ncbi:SCO5717 family growth-regulating ATPase, partial [Streptomyces sp. CO7]
MNSDRDGIHGGWTTPGDDQSDAESAVETTGEFTIDYDTPAWYRENAGQAVDPGPAAGGSPDEDASEGAGLPFGGGSLESGATMRISASALRQEIAERAAAAVGSVSPGSDSGSGDEAAGAASGAAAAGAGEGDAAAGDGAFVTSEPVEAGTGAAAGAGDLTGADADAASGEHGGQGAVEAPQVVGAGGDPAGAADVTSAESQATAAPGHFGAPVETPDVEGRAAGDDAGTGAGAEASAGPSGEDREDGTGTAAEPAGDASAERGEAGQETAPDAAVAAAEPQGAAEAGRMAEGGEGGLAAAAPEHPAAHQGWAPQVPSQEVPPQQ